MTSAREYPVRRFDGASAASATRAIPVEAPIAIEFNGIGYAVMMATPSDLEDFGTGFALSERLITHAAQIDDIHLHEGDAGWVMRIAIPQDRMAAVVERVRTRASESSCGLCGLESLEQIARPLPKLAQTIEVSDQAIFAALAELTRHQPLSRSTGGTHAAAFCAADGRIIMAREDVGRHCALDKLIGALARAGISASTGFFLLSSRCSYELVEKAVIAGVGLLVTISTATSLAIDRAAAAGLRLIALARSDAALEF